MNLTLTPLNPATNFPVQNSQPEYRGVERRRGPRRVSEERRSVIRFEPGINARRSGDDQRAGGAWNKAGSC